MTDLERRFWRYHEDNLHVYEMFKRFTFEATRIKDHYSARAIFHRMRWFTEIETHGDIFKINNNYSPYYARMFVKDFPQHKGFFRTRILAGQRTPLSRVTRDGSSLGEHSIG